jgi:hypothetical protein
VRKPYGSGWGPGGWFWQSGGYNHYGFVWMCGPCAQEHDRTACFAAGCALLYFGVPIIILVALMLFCGR